MTPVFHNISVAAGGKHTLSPPSKRRFWETTLTVDRARAQ